MIRKIGVEALKSIKNIQVECSKLNLLVGTNSSGKSSFLQSILLVAQNTVEEEGLNGSLVSLGEFREVRNYSMPRKAIKIRMWGEEKDEADWIAFEESETEEYEIQSSMGNEIWSEQFEELDAWDSGCLPTAGMRFYYLSCHRIGVQDIYEKNMKKSGNFGIDGEYALAYLLKNENEPVPDELVKETEKYTNNLLGQVNYWLNNIVETELTISDLKKTNYLQVKYNNNPANSSQESLYCRPVNVGSGISYLISIIIVCLASEKESVILIENPEIHLHPKAQSRLCQFLYFVSQSGRQLFVETHSDHIFNGLRVGVATHEIPMEDLSVNFFSLNENYETINNPIVFGKYGKITGKNKDADLDDLFDQFEIDTDRMLGL